MVRFCLPLLFLVVGCASVPLPDADQQMKYAIEPGQVFLIGFGARFPISLPARCQTEFGTAYFGGAWKRSIALFMRRKSSVPTEYLVNWGGCILCITMCDHQQMSKVLKWLDASGIKVLYVPQVRSRKPDIVTPDVAKPTLLIGWYDNEKRAHKILYPLTDSQAKKVRNLLEKVAREFVDFGK